MTEKNLVTYEIRTMDTKTITHSIQ